MEATTEKITFEQHKKRTAEDCEALAEMIKGIAASVRDGNLDSFEKFFMEDGTPEGDAKVIELLERLLLRYIVRKDIVE